MTTVDAAVAAELASMPLTRLAHFTPARNLPHIIGDGELRSVQDMDGDVRACYTPTDLRRLDGYKDKICCSFEYPNGFYYRQAVGKPELVNYSDWVCLLIDKSAAAASGTLFCPRNAAAWGVPQVPGVAGLRGCYVPAVRGSGGSLFRRGGSHSPACATDVQAEILVTGPIPLSAVRAIVSPSVEAAAQEHARLTQVFRPPPQHIDWIISSDMFDKDAITRAVRSGQRFPETVWTPPGSPAPVVSPTGTM